MRFRRLALAVVLPLLGSISLAAATPRACTQACKQGRTACIADARQVFTSAKGTCLTDGTTPRRCIKAAKRALTRAKRGCEAFRRDTCAPCCRAGGVSCTSTTSTLPTTTVTTTTTTTSLPANPCAPGGNGVPTGFRETVHITSSGDDRTYALFVPPDYDSSHAYPLVFGFHGDGGSGVDIRVTLGLEAQANGAAIFVYPDATEESGRSFALDVPLASNVDMALFRDLVTTLAATYCIDRQRVFATGLSRGGYFVNFLNCRLGSTWLRAIAAQSGSGPYGLDSEFDQDGHFICEAPAAAALGIHGTLDDVVPIADGEYSRDQWVWENGCAATTMPVSPPPCFAYDGCDPGKPVVWCAIPGLGHASWSGAPATVWSFFASFP